MQVQVSRERLRAGRARMHRLERVEAKKIEQEQRHAVLTGRANTRVCKERAQSISEGEAHSYISRACLSEENATGLCVTGRVSTHSAPVCLLWGRKRKRKKRTREEEKKLTPRRRLFSLKTKKSRARNRATSNGRDAICVSFESSYLCEFRCDKGRWRVPTIRKGPWLFRTL